jgi:hypothetical protein
VPRAFIDPTAPRGSPATVALWLARAVAATPEKGARPTARALPVTTSDKEQSRWGTPCLVPGYETCTRNASDAKVTVSLADVVAVALGGSPQVGSLGEFR